MSSFLRMTTMVNSRSTEIYQNAVDYNSSDITARDAITSADAKDITPFATPNQVYSIVVLSVVVVILCFCVPIMCAYTNRGKSRYRTRHESNEGDTNNAMTDDNKSDPRYAARRRENIDSALLTEKFVSSKYHARLPDIEEGNEETPSIGEESYSLPMNQQLGDASNTSRAALLQESSTSRVIPLSIDITKTGDLSAILQELELQTSPSYSSSASCENNHCPSTECDSLQTDLRPVVCSICLVDYVDGDEICKSRNKKCKHVFHRSCIKQWLMWHDDCPYCRCIYLEKRASQKVRLLIQGVMGNRADLQSSQSDHPHNSFPFRPLTNTTHNVTLRARHEPESS